MLWEEENDKLKLMENQDLKGGKLGQQMASPTYSHAYSFKLEYEIIFSW